MDLSVENLTSQSEIIAKCLRQSEKWLNSENAVINSNKVGLENFFLDVTRHQRDLEEAIHERPAIGVFGASQVGKSYLVANLVKPSELDELMIHLPEQQESINFIKDINPQGGGKESTGIVTRFSTDPKLGPNHAPFRLKFFSQCDVTKVILNGYLSDINDNTYEIDRDALQQKLQEHFQRINESTTEQIGFDRFEVISLKHYVNEHFSNHYITKFLNDINFWEDLKRLLPYMHASMRYEVLEFLWGKHVFFSDLFKKASKSLEKIGFKSEAFCALEALSPSNKTIIDVERLREPFKQYSGDSVTLFEMTGSLGVLGRSDLSLITVEVCLPIALETAESKGREFLKQADVLDFPGARSRNKILEQTFQGNSDVEKLEVFLRGKVAYLFDKYNKNFGLSTLIYCMDDTQQEVQDIPHLIYSWLQRIHGSSPENRQKREDTLKSLLQSQESFNPLFVIQTKYNNDLQGNPSLEVEGDPSTHDWKWESRLEANFRQFMTRPLSDKWIDHWTPYDSFRNVFFLRDPKWSQNVFERQGDVEFGVREIYSDRLQDMKDSFMKNKSIDGMFYDKAESWQSSSTPGQSGVQLITRYLLPTCNPRIKHMQLYDHLGYLKKKIDRELRKYYIDADIKSELQKANAKSLSVLSLISAHRDKKIFGAFLDAIVLEDNTAWKIAYDLLVRGRHTGKSKIKGPISIDLVETLKKMGMEISLQDDPQVVLQSLKSFFGIDDDEQLVEGCSAVGINIDSLIDFLKEDSDEKTVPEIFAQDLISYWFERLQDLRQTSDPQRWGINEYTLELLIDEIKLSAERVDLLQKVANLVEPSITHFIHKDDLKIIARLSTHVVNDFIGTLGWSDIPLAKRPQNELNQQIFDLGEGKYPDKKSLTLHLNTTNENLFVDWCTGLKETFSTNVYFKYGNNDQSQSPSNLLLGKLLDDLSKVSD